MEIEPYLPKFVLNFGVYFLSLSKYISTMACTWNIKRIVNNAVLFLSGSPQIRTDDNNTSWHWSQFAMLDLSVKHLHKLQVSILIYL